MPRVAPADPRGAAAVQVGGTCSAQGQGQGLRAEGGERQGREAQGRWQQGEEFGGRFELEFVQDLSDLISVVAGYDSRC